MVGRISVFIDGSERYTEKGGVNLVTERTVDLILRTPAWKQASAYGAFRGAQAGGEGNTAVIFLIVDLTTELESWSRSHTDFPGCPGKLWRKG